MKILYVQTIKVDRDLHITSRLGLIRALVAAGCAVTFVASYERGAPNLPGIDWVRVPSWRRPYMSQLSYNVLTHAVVFWHILWRRYDCVILDPYTFHCAFPWDLLARVGLVRTRIVMDVRSGIFHERSRRGADLVRRVLMRVGFTYARALHSGFTTISPMLRDILQREFRVPAERIGVWQSGVVPDIFDVTPTEPALRLPSGKFIVMYHGVLDGERGLPETIQAMRRVSYRRPSILLFILGRGSELGRLRELAAGQPNVMFHDAVPHGQVPAFIARCDVGIMPFKPTLAMRSSSPLKLLEYLAAGKPVIASRLEAFVDVVGDRAVFLEAQTPDAIGEAIIYAADHRAAIAEWGEAGRRIVETRYTWTQQARHLLTFLEGLA